MFQDETRKKKKVVFIKPKEDATTDTDAHKFHAERQLEFYHSNTGNDKEKPTLYVSKKLCVLCKDALKAFDENSNKATTGINLLETTKQENNNNNNNNKQQRKEVNNYEEVHALKVLTVNRKTKPENIKVSDNYNIQKIKASSERKNLISLYFSGTGYLYH